MSRKVSLFLRDMFTRAERVAKVADRHTFEEFRRDENVYEATLRNIEILGEAAKNVTQEVRDQAPDIEWRSIARTRDVLAHVYFGIKDEIIWEIVTVKAKALLRQLPKLIHSVENDESRET